MASAAAAIHHHLPAPPRSSSIGSSSDGPAMPARTSRIAPIPRSSAEKEAALCGPLVDLLGHRAHHQRVKIAERRRQRMGRGNGRPKLL